MPIDLDAQKFDVVGMNYLLRCLPRTMESKAVVFEHLKGLLAHGARPARRCLDRLQAKAHECSEGTPSNVLWANLDDRRWIRPGASSWRREPDASSSA